MRRVPFLKKKNEEKEIARERMHVLFKEAEKTASSAFAKRYVHLARTIGMKYRVHVPQEWKHSFCKSCGIFWHVSKTLRLRTRAGRIIYTCLSCNEVTRLPYKPRRENSLNVKV